MIDEIEINHNGSAYPYTLAGTFIMNAASVEIFPYLMHTFSVCSMAQLSCPTGYKFELFCELKQDVTKHHLMNHLHMV